MKKSCFAVAIIMALVLCLSFGASAVISPQFSDVDEGAWYAETVNYFAATGIIDGYNDGTFRPECNVTRAEFATMLFNYLNRMDSTGTDEPERIIVFSDVNEGDWYYEAVMTLGNYGLINGYSDGTFRPGNDITREEIAYIMYKFIGPRFIREEGAPEDAYIFFPDVLADRWSADAINTLVYFGAIQGYPDGTFRPGNNATRAEAVTFLYNFFDQPN